MNRILAFLNKPCRCTLARRKLRRLAAECRRIEAIAGVFQFVVPSTTTYLQGKREVSIWLDVEIPTASTKDSMQAFAIVELRNAASQLLGAADRLEGGAA